MPVTFYPEEITGIIQDNREMCVENQEYFDVNMQIINDIFTKINLCNSVLDPRGQIIRKAAYILSLITSSQPFHENNRHTALSTARDFLRRNCLDLTLNTIENEREIFKLLYETKIKKRDDPTLVEEVEKYLTMNVVEYFRWRY